MFREKYTNLVRYEILLRRPSIPGFEHSASNRKRTSGTQKAVENSHDTCLVNFFAPGQLNNKLWNLSCSAVGRAVISDTRDLRFESSHQ